MKSRADCTFTPPRPRRQKLKYQRKVIAKLSFCRSGKAAWASRWGQSAKWVSFMSVGFAGPIVSGYTDDLSVCPKGGHHVLHPAVSSNPFAVKT
jgi:hypothetical protein